MSDGRAGRVMPIGEAACRYKHGHAGTKSRTYLSWRAMTARCTNEKDPAYLRYGGRGIKVCDRWREFDNFLADMGERPEGKSLDRWPDNNGNYEPSNCRWATRQEQQYNRRDNVLVTIDGETKCLTEWCRKYGISTRAVLDRREKGWSIERSITAPKTRRHDHGVPT